MRFGEELRQQRERRGISLDDVSLSTRISLRHLHALEADRFSDLPGGVFNRGIVRSYAQACGLDAEGIVQNFLAATRASGLPLEQREDDWVEFAEAVRRNRVVPIAPKPVKWVGVALMILGVIALATGVSWLLLRKGLLHLPPRMQQIENKILSRHSNQETSEGAQP